VNPLGTSVDEHLRRIGWRAIVGLCASLTLNQANRFAVGDINGGQQDQFIGHHESLIC
jgi:hypothetical protein